MTSSLTLRACCIKTPATSSFSCYPPSFWGSWGCQVDIFFILFLFLARFPVDYLSHSFVPCPAFILCQFAAFTYCVINCFICIATYSTLAFLPLFTFLFIYLILKATSHETTAVRHLPPISKTIQIRGTRHAGPCWKSRNELINDALLRTPSNRRTIVCRPKRTYLQQHCTDTECIVEELPWVMDDRDEWQERSPCLQHDLMMKRIIYLFNAIL